MSRAGLARWVLVGLAAGWLAGCASVAPWQRGHLARPDMGLEQVAPARALDKTYASKEAASGGGAVGGGGCGCN